jgi:hypothetical protein
VAFETAWRHDELIKDVLRKDGLRKIDREIKFEKFE